MRGSIQSSPAVVAVLLLATACEALAQTRSMPGGSGPLTIRTAAPSGGASVGERGGARGGAAPAPAGTARLPLLLAPDHRAGRSGGGWPGRGGRGRLAGASLPFCWGAPCVAGPLSDVWFGASVRRAGLLFSVPFYFEAPVYADSMVPAAAERPAARPKVIDVASLGAREALSVEWAGAGIVRLTRRDDGRSVTEVVLFVADSASRAVAVQTVREPPYTALFDVTPRVAFVGLTVVYADGVRTTVLVPYPPER